MPRYTSQKGGFHGTLGTMAKSATAVSANLDSSSSLSKDKRLVVVVTLTGVAHLRRAFEFGVWPRRRRCYVSVSRAACPRTHTEASNRPGVTDRQTTRLWSQRLSWRLSFCSELLLLGQNCCCYACMVRACVIFSQ